MAEGPWRCSQCGTVNEPVANACRRCGRWPSLFDLEASTLDNSATADELDVEEAFDDEPYVEELPYEEPYVEEPAEAEQTAPRQAEPAEEASDVPERKWRGPEPAIPEREGAWVRRLSRVAVPLIVVGYVLVTALRN